MEDVIRIWKSPDNTIAKLWINSSQITFDEIKFQLKTEGVIAWIKDELIKENLKKIKQNNEPIGNIIVAEYIPPIHVITFEGKSKEINSEIINDIKNKYKAIGQIVNDIKIYNNNDFSCEAGKWVNENEIFLVITKEGNEINIAGEKYTSNKRFPKFNCSSTIYYSPSDEVDSYSAKKSGFLIINEKDEFEIISPSIDSEDKMSQYFIFLPLIDGHTNLLKYYHEFIHKNKHNKALLENLPNEKEILKILAENKVKKIKIREGKPPLPGKNEDISYKISIDKIPESNTDEQINYKDLSIYTEIKSGEIIAVKKPAENGEDGYDIFGHILHAPSPKLSKITFLENITEQTDENNNVSFIANTTGILEIRNNKVNVKEFLIINGDVDYSTGNVIFSKSVEIKGTLRAGFTIQCGGDCIIRESVENGGIIKCAGNLIVENGIFGKSSEIIVKGDINAGFIQDSNIQSRGNVIVDSFIYDSYVYAEKSILLNGNKLRIEGKGALLGGKIIAMENMQIVSAGSESSNTEICCGIDPEKLEATKDISLKLSLLNRKVSFLKNNIGINLNDPNALNFLKRLPEARKKIVKEKLAKLKSVIDEQQLLDQKVKKLEKLALNSNIETCTIKIKKDIYPDVKIRIGKSCLTIKEHISSATFRSLDNEILKV